MTEHINQLPKARLQRVAKEQRRYMRLADKEIARLQRKLKSTEKKLAEVTAHYHSVTQPEERREIAANFAKNLGFNFDA